jgi:bifunctional DNA-binding transcriptional regulator/antitoxin component of YhaV-PrlF toxin-antitoxin module
MSYEFIDDIKLLDKTKYVSIPIKICRALKLEKGDSVKLIIEREVLAK